MKTFKHTDILISLFLICFFTLFTLIDPDLLLIGYFVVGGWQVISMLVHQIKKHGIHRGSARRTYHGVLAIILLIAALLTGAYFFKLIEAGGILPLLIIMLVAAPFMAICYTAICYREYQAIKDRELVQLR